MLQARRATACIHVSCGVKVLKTAATTRTKAGLAFQAQNSAKHLSPQHLAAGLGRYGNAPIAMHSFSLVSSSRSPLSMYVSRAVLEAVALNVRA